MRFELFRCVFGCFCFFFFVRCVLRFFDEFLTMVGEFLFCLMRFVCFRCVFGCFWFRSVRFSFFR